jgi:hypothetical protein
MKLTPLILCCSLTLGMPAMAQTTTADISVGKDYGSVSVNTAAPARGSPGSAVNVPLVYAGLPMAGAAVTYRTEGALMLVSAGSTQLKPDASGAARDTVTVKAASAGVYFLNVFAKTGNTTKAVSIPVSIGGASLKPSTRKSTAKPNGDRVIEMPAQQTVR